MSSHSSLSFSQQERSLSLPGSRLVMNPYAFEALDSSVSQAQYTDQSSLPLHIGYCCPHIRDHTGLEWRNASVVYSRIACGGLPPVVVWQAGKGADTAWKEHFGPGFHRLQNDGLSFGISDVPDRESIYILETPEIECDIDRTVLDIRLERLAKNNRLALKIRRIKDDATVCLSLYTEPGISSFALSERTGWHGRQRISLEMHALGEPGETASISLLCLRQIEVAFQTASYWQRRWEPALLMTKAGYPDGSTVEISDYLADTVTMIRAFEFNQTEKMVLAGCCFSVPAISDNILQISNRYCQARISVTDAQGRPAQGLWQLYPSLADFLSDYGGIAPAAKEPLSITDASGHPFWSFTPAQKGKCLLMLVIQMGPNVSSFTPVPSLPSQSLWHTLLENIPRPKHFGYHLLTTDDKSSALLEKMYFTAWAQVIANILPPAPEVSFPYASMATGKSSLWAYGADRCSYAASWETFYGWMLYAQIDPVAAWKGYEGFMTLVDKDGRLGGESLPSVKARTAWVLYCTFPDRKRLDKVRPAIERYLYWRLENLRWIYLNKTPREDQKDMDFVTAALLDIHYLIRICHELSLTDKANEWQGRMNNLYRQMTEWFFSNDLPHQYFLSSTGDTADGNPLCILKALHLPCLAGSERTSLLKLFRLHYRPDRPFGGFDGVKVENMSYTIYGLAENGLTAEADLLRERTAYDIASTQFLAEEYHVSGRTILPSGVRPSLFGCALLIDCVLGMNGLRLDDGGPLPTGLCGNVFNVMCGGSRQDFNFNK